MFMFVNWLESLNVDLNITDKCSRKRNGSAIFVKIGIQIG